MESDVLAKYSPGYPTVDEASFYKEVVEGVGTEVLTRNQQPVLNPYTYINSLPSKNVRQTLIAALNSWYKVPMKSLLIIEGAVNFLHNSSLL